MYALHDRLLECQLAATYGSLSGSRGESADRQRVSFFPFVSSPRPARLARSSSTVAFLVGLDNLEEPASLGSAGIGEEMNGGSAMMSDGIR